tara:strand:+ start:617 stop:1216 length:600 start_codon:yes stop_codon:yes gene_type:complete
MNKYKVNEQSADLPVGTILYWAGTNVNNLPSTWKVCNGAYLSTTAYPDLFSQIGSTYGISGSNFRLPDLTGLRIRGASSFSSGHSASSVGNGSVTLGNTNLPYHNHGATNWYHTHSSDDKYKFHDVGGTGYAGYANKGNTGLDDGDYLMMWRYTDYQTMGGTAYSYQSGFNSNTAYQGSSSALTLNPSFINLYAIIKVL